MMRDHVVLTHSTEQSDADYEHEEEVDRADGMSWNRSIGQRKDDRLNKWSAPQYTQIGQLYASKLGRKACLQLS